VVAELRAYLAEKGITEAGVRNGLMKLRPIPELRDSQQVRLRRKYPTAVYKEVSGTLLLNVPAADTPRWVLDTLRDILDPQ
jgi:transcription-repair coupling factor (superfamily II helicase)